MGFRWKFPFVDSRNKDQVKVVAREEKGDYFVEIYLPPVIDGKPFQSVSLFKGKPVYDANEMDHDFHMTLNVWEVDDNKLYSFYSIKPFLAKDNYLSFSYGEGCGMYIEYPVEFE